MTDLNHLLVEKISFDFALGLKKYFTNIMTYPCTKNTVLEDRMDLDHPMKQQLMNLSKQCPFMNIIITFAFQISREKEKGILRPAMTRRLVVSLL